MIPALAAFQQLDRVDPMRALAKFKSGAQVQREIDYFKANIQKVASIDDLLKNRRLAAFVLSAYGLDSEINALGRIKAALKADPADINSFVNKIADKRFREMASDLQTYATGVKTLQDPAKVVAVADRYVDNEYEKSLGKQNPAIREARYFEKKIGGITDVYQILADRVLRTVAFKVLGIPPQAAVQPVESQAQLLRSRLNLTQFRSAAASSAGAATASLKTDLSALALGATLGDAASKAAREAATRLAAIKAGYDGLAAVQDPAGVNAAEIPVQEAAIPELVRQRGLAEAAQTALADVADDFNRLSELRRLASDPANAAELAAYKTEFADLTAEIHSAISTTADYRIGNQTRNLLDGTGGGPYSVQIDSSGTTVTLDEHDMTAFLAGIDDAAASFAAVADASDTANLDATRDSLAAVGAQIGDARDGLIADRAAADAAIAAVPVWAATLDTVALGLGRSSVADSDARASQIADKLAAIRAVAAESAARAPGDDRSDLEAQLASLKADIDALIATPGAGLDNILQGVTHNYALVAGSSVRVANRQLDSSIGTPLASGSVSDAASAQALVDQINDTLLPAMTFARERLAIDRAVLTQAATVLDPRGKLDEQLRTLATELPAIRDKANSILVGKNLLAADATGYVIPLKTQTGTIFTLNAQPGFTASVIDAATAAVAQLPGNLWGPGGAYELLTVAASAASDIADAIDRDRRALDPTLLDVKRKLASAPATDAAAAKPTEFTRRFVLRYLALSDNEQARAGFGSPTLALFGAGPPTGLDISGLASLRGGGIVV